MARHKDIYNKNRWKKIRLKVIARDEGLCQECKRQGRIKAGIEVHHITELTHQNKNNWDIAYNINNLELLCWECHQDTRSKGSGLDNFTIPIPPTG